MIELYDHPVSPCAQKVRLVLAEKSIDYQLNPVDLSAKQNLSPEYLKLNPAGLVPTLVIDGQPIPESTVICELLDDLYPEVALRPADPFDLAQMRRWTKRLDESLHAACGALQWPMFMLPVLAQMSEEDAEALLARREHGGHGEGRRRRGRTAIGQLKLELHRRRVSPQPREPRARRPCRGGRGGALGDAARAL